MNLIKELYKTSEVAELLKVSPDTIRLWVNNQTLPSEYVKRLPSGRIRITRAGVLYLLKMKGYDTPKKTFIYARESSSHQKQSLERQIEYLTEWANANGYSVDEIVTDIASGMNFNRKGLQYIIEQAEKGILGTLIISYKDRLARFGFEFIQWLLNKHGCDIVIVNNIDDKPNSTQEIIEDMISIIHYFSMKLYGARHYKQKSKKIEECINEAIQDK
jgi:predicted site-specific integrase-resolvase